MLVVIERRLLMDNFRRTSIYVTELPINAKRLELSDYNTTIIKKLYIPIISNPLTLTSNQVGLYYSNQYDNYCNDYVYFISCDSMGRGTDLYNTYPVKEKYVGIGTRSNSNLTPYQFSIDGGVEYLGDDGYEYGYIFHLFYYSQYSGLTHDKNVTKLYSFNQGTSILPPEFYDGEYSLEDPLYVCVDSRNFIPGIEKTLPYIMATGYEQKYGSGSSSSGILTTSIPKYPIYIEPA